MKDQELSIRVPKIRAERLQELHTVPGVYYVAKKGKQYICIRNNEFAKTPKQKDALVMSSEKDWDDLVAYMCIDDRNDRFIGNSYGVCDVTIPAGGFDPRKKP